MTPVIIYSPLCSIRIFGDTQGLCDFESKGRVTTAQSSRKAVPMRLLKHLEFATQKPLYSSKCLSQVLHFVFKVLGFFPAETDNCCDQSFICNFISHELLLRLGATCVFALWFFFLNYRLKKILLKHA